jgi:hypothetical protein
MILKKNIITRIQRLYKQKNPDVILVFGNQKSGTSAIASLLADYAGKSKTIDIPGLWPPIGREIMQGDRRFESCLAELNLEFSRDVVKEPMMTFFADQVLESFLEAKGIFIVRDPRDNIRSLLNRRELSGALKNIDGLKMAAGKTLVGDPDVWGGISDRHNYIDQMAVRWNAAYEQYLKNSDRLVLVRYEDFLADKLGFIADLASMVGLSQKASIEHFINVQYQPKGNNRATYIDFFGKKNLQKIEQRCGKYLIELDYPITVI